MSEREIVLRERAAFVKGVEWRFGEALKDAPQRSFRPVVDHAINAAAMRAFPLPTITRPRVVTDKNGIQWRLQDGSLQWLGASGVWARTQEYNGMSIYADRIKIWADLLENPNEAVDE